MTAPAFPIRLFQDIDSALVTDSVNQLIVELNALFVQGGITPIPGTMVTMKQVYSWAAANGNPLYVYTLDQACPADIANPINYQWTRSGTMVQNDPLYNFIASTLGFNPAQMLSAFSAMGSFTP